MVALRQFAGQIAELFDRPQSAGHDLVLEFQRRGIFEKGGKGGYRGNLGAQAHSADAAMLLLAFAVDKPSASDAARVAVDLYKMDCAVGASQTFLGRWDDRDVVGACEAHPGAVSLGWVFGEHLCHAIRVRRRVAAGFEEITLTDKSYLDVDQWAVGVARSKIHGATELVGNIFTSQRIDDELLRHNFTYYGKMAGSLPYGGKYRVATIPLWDGALIDKVVEFSGSLSADESALDEKINYRDVPRVRTH